jgi:tetratricopeptide (TPR) repeat protein
LALPKRLSLNPPNDCSGCHLPKRDVKRIAHSLLTNHRIITRAGEHYPEVAFHQTTSALPDLIHVNAIPGKAAADISPLTLLQVYGTLMDAQPGFRKRYLSLLDQLSKTQPNHLLVLSALARKASLQGTRQGQAQAQQYLQQAIELGSTATSDYQDLAELLARDGRLSEAVQVLKQGIDLNPYSSGLYKSLALRYIAMKKYPDALETMKRQLELFPEDSFMRKLIKQAERAGPTR